jgi:hypothetical protein
VIAPHTVKHTMRDFKNMKRQRGRNRGGGGGGGKPQHNANRAFDSNGPDNVKIRGHAQHVFEKYQQLARDAFSSGDRVLAENYLQHADHYFRVLRTIQPQRPPSEILGRDVLASGLDIDFEEEFEAQPEDAGVAEAEAGGEVNGAEGGRPPREERPPREDRFSRDDRPPRDDRYERGEVRREPRDGYERRDDREGRYEGRRDGEGQPRDREGGYRERGERNDRYERGGEGRDRFEGRRERRFEGRREDRPSNREGREPRYDDRRPADAAADDPMPVVAPESAAPFPAPAAEAVESSPVLRSQDGASSEAPAFLQAPSSEDGEARRPRPRRRRAPRSFEASEGGEDAASPHVEIEEV